MRRDAPALVHPQRLRTSACCPTSRSTCTPIARAVRDGHAPDDRRGHADRFADRRRRDDRRRRCTACSQPIRSTGLRGSTGVAAAAERRRRHRLCRQPQRGSRSRRSPSVVRSTTRRRSSFPATTSSSTRSAATPAARPTRAAWRSRASGDRMYLHQPPAAVAADLRHVARPRRASRRTWASARTDICRQASTLAVDGRRRWRARLRHVLPGRPALHRRPARAVDGRGHHHSSVADRTRSPRRRRRKKVYVTNFLEDTIAVIDVVAGRRRRTIASSSASGSEGASEDGSRLLAACSRRVRRHDAQRRPTQLNLDRPVDVAFACYGGLRVTNGSRRPPIRTSRISAQPIAGCDIRSSAHDRHADAGAARPGELIAPGARRSPSASYFAFILQSEPGTVAIADLATKPSTSFRAAGVDVIVEDADPLTPGKNGISVGEDPVAIANRRRRMLRK